MARQLRVIPAAQATPDQLQYAAEVAFVDENGNPVDIGGGSAASRVAWSDVTGKPAAAAAIADPADNADASALAANQKKILAALRTWGIVNPK